MNNILDNMIAGNNMKAVIGRNRITSLCYSQRLIYEVSDIANDSVSNYGFCYRKKMNGTFTNDNGKSALHAAAGTSSAGELCSSIYENMQHTDLFYFGPGASDLGKWHVKPVMKIKKEDFNNPLLKNTPVVKINSLNYLGDIISSVTLRVDNFRDSNGTYNGDYIENYLFNLKDSLQINGIYDSLKAVKGLNDGYTGKNPERSKVDFQVYWYGLVDVWFNKMIVDDEGADKLFRGVYDVKIKDEAESFGDKMTFFADEIVSSQAYTTRYIKDKLKEYNPNAKLSFAISNNLNRFSHRKKEYSSKMLLEITQPDIIQIDAHPFPLDDTFRGFIPENIAGSDLIKDKRIPTSWYMRKDAYNDVLQNLCFGNKTTQGNSYQGTFLYQIEQVKKELEDLGQAPRIIIQPQLQGWIDQASGKFTSGGQREPTNEEIEAQAGIAIANGADGLCWFFYSSFQTSSINDSKTIDVTTGIFKNVYGLRNQFGDSVYTNLSKRTQNIYGQNKWEYVKQMNKKILNWKPVLDKINWSSGYSVHSEGENHEYINDIKSFYRNSSMQYSYEDAVKYWEIGFFSPVDVNDKAKYFIVVNRRCVPETSAGAGDLRELKIKFSSADLGSDKWKITDVNTNQTVVTINKNSGEYYDMGIFNPGEGKLYKIEPVN
jgi:hypothetical protein